ncbi:MAG TPA: family 43 glycosylhydrolase [Planctomycetota bacterium]|nr:family 43 glycosylhydrolase [Planctomycetota bacterium]
MKYFGWIGALLLASGIVFAGDAAGQQAITQKGDQYAPLWTPQITEVDRVREGKWGGAMWCPFVGTAVKLIGNTTPASGIADVYIDGVFQKTVDWYSPTETADVVLFSADGLADGKHLLGVLARERKRAESSGTALHWSRVEYTPGKNAGHFVPPKRTRFDPNVPLWLDDRGESIQCHMGGIMFHEGRYYMAGHVWPNTERRLRELPNDWFRNAGIAVYSSPDLLNWTFHGSYCAPVKEAGHPLQDEKNITARPKLIRARGTGKFVMLFQLVSPTFVNPNATAVAVSNKPEGPYEWRGFLQCEGKPVQGSDTAVFTDEDGAQYFLSGLKNPDGSGWNVSDVLYQLAPDCLSVEKCKRLGTGGEAPAIFKHEGVYYLLHSHLTGLRVNENFYHTAKNIWGPWEAKGKIAHGPHSENTFQTQTTDVIPVSGKRGAFIWIGDSIRDNMAPHARTVWLPVTLKENSEMEIRWLDSWDFSVFNAAK